MTSEPATARIQPRGFQERRDTDSTPLTWQSCRAAPSASRSFLPASLANWPTGDVGTASDGSAASSPVSADRPAFLPSLPPVVGLLRAAALPGPRRQCKRRNASVSLTGEGGGGPGTLLLHQKLASLSSICPSGSGIHCSAVQSTPDRVADIREQDRWRAAWNAGARQPQLRRPREAAATGARGCVTQATSSVYAGSLVLGRCTLPCLNTAFPWFPRTGSTRSHDCYIRLLHHPGPILSTPSWLNRWFSRDYMSEGPMQSLTGRPVARPLTQCTVGGHR